MSQIVYEIFKHFIFNFFMIYSKLPGLDWSVLFPLRTLRISHILRIFFCDSESPVTLNYLSIVTWARLSHFVNSHWCHISNLFYLFLGDLLSSTEKILITVNVNGQNDDGETALHIAIENGNLELIDLLLKFNPNLELADGKQR